MRVENGSGAGSAVDAATMAAIGMQIGQSGQNEDAFSKNIRKQIEQKQQELSELSAKEELSPEEKMKRRQELTKEISDLNMQLRQHQMEKRMQEKAERQKKSQDAQNAGTQSAARTAKGTKKAQAAGFSVEGMSALLSADAAMNQAQVQGSVSNKMENRANVLKQEIKLDSARGGVTERKEAELAGVEAKAVSAAAAQAGSLRDVNERVHDAAEAERSHAAEAERGDTAEAERSDVVKAERSDKAEAEPNHAAEAERGDATKAEPSHAAEAGRGDAMEAEQSGKTRNAERAGTDVGGAAGTAEKSQSEMYPPVDVRI
ncbi:MAG: FlxA-like family protein [Clostridium sp.]|nr:FlxA-like family protein [Clostridium sp.]